MNSELQKAELSQGIAEVRGSLDLTDSGAIKNSIRNCLTVFMKDPLLQGAISYNLLTERIDIVKPLWWSKQTATLTDTDLNYLMLYLEDNYALTSEKKIQKAIAIVADCNKYHPIRDYLNSLECLWRWCKRRHPKKSHKWIAKKYFRRVGTRNWTFSVNMADSFELHLIYATDTKIVRWLKTKSEATPFDERFTEYFEDRDTKRMLREINGRKKLNALYKMQKGICPHCGEPITVEQGFRIHTEMGADFKEKNVLLHADCHRELHYSKMLMNWFC